MSVDGPKHIHDAARRTRKGAGTHDKTVTGMKLLQKHEISFYVISVLTRRALLNPEAMFEFYRQHDIHDVGFNIEEKEGSHTTTSLMSAGISDIAFSFFKRFSELMVERDYPIAVREFEEALCAIKFSDQERRKVTSGSLSALLRLTLKVMSLLSHRSLLDTLLRIFRILRSAIYSKIASMI